MCRVLAVAAATAALGAPVAASAMDSMSHGGGAEVSIAFQAYQPGDVTALAGESVMWRNESARSHTVTSDDGTWGSGTLFSTSTYEHRFDAPGRFTYYCKVHAGMRGAVDVYDLLLQRPSDVLAPGQATTLHGRSALAEGTPVTIEADEGTGFRPAAETTVGPDGTFGAAIRPSASGSYRAVSGTETSPAVQVHVENRSVRAAARRRGGRAAITVRVAPSAPGATVVLQVASREHFGWWPTRRARLGRDSRARFVLHTRRRLRMRVVLTLRDGATALATSPQLRLAAARSSR